MIRRAVALMMFLSTCLITIEGCGGGGSSTQPFANCGNGTVDAGEDCDDGNILDSDDCLSTCILARCGDSFIDTDSEACDGTNFGRKSCASFNLSDGAISCVDDCTRIDTSACGVPFTVTATATVTPTPTSTPTPESTPTALAGVCGDGEVEEDETCDDGNVLDGDACPADCRIRPCTPSGATLKFDLQVNVPSGASSVTTLVLYPDGIISLPGTGSDSSIGVRITRRARGTFRFDDLEYALSSTATFLLQPFSCGRLFTMEFDRCTDADPPRLDEFECRVLTCTSNAGPLADCRCAVVSATL